VRRTFSDASTCPGVTSPPPPDALRAFNLPQFAHAKRSRLRSLKARRSFKSLSRLRSLKARRSFKSLSRLRSLKAMRSFKSLSRLRSLKARRSFKSLSRLRSLKARRSFESLSRLEEIRYLCLRSPGGGEDLKNFILVPPIATWR